MALQICKNMAKMSSSKISSFSLLRKPIVSHNRLYNSKVSPLSSELDKYLAQKISQLEQQSNLTYSINSTNRPDTFLNNTPNSSAFKPDPKNTNKNSDKNNLKKLITVNGITEAITQRSEYPIEKIRTILKNDTFAVLGYGTQGRGQALNLRDNGFEVVVGLRNPDSDSWLKAIEDGFVPGKTLLPLSDAIKKNTVIMYLLSDAGQKQAWSLVKPLLTPEKTLYFSHGFSIVFAKQTGVIPPADIDVIMVAPKGTGTTLRKTQNVNSSVAVFQDISGNALERANAIGFAIGSGYIFDTTFEKEVWSDLTGERGSLMGAMAGLFQAQYDVLRENGHSPSEAYNETVEEATQSLIPLISENGMAWMFRNCSTTAQRGALNWAPVFANVLKPTIQQLYTSVKSGNETKIVLNANSDPEYRKKLDAELDKMENSEIWQIGSKLREIRP
jgi:ketol-acid reductoisomerase